MKLMLLALALGAGIYFLEARHTAELNSRQPTPLSVSVVERSEASVTGGQITAARASGDAAGCEHKQKCVVFYMAPWCPACKATLPTVFEIQRRFRAEGANGTRGLRILVGADKPASCKRTAAELGPGAESDDGDAFAKAHHVISFPTWLVLDSSGAEIRKLSVGFEHPEMAELFLKQGLGL